MKRLINRRCNISSTKSISKKSGLTLIELVVALAIMGIVLTAAFHLLSFNQKSYSTINIRVNAQNEFRFYMDYLEKEIGTTSEVQLLNNVDLSLDVETDYRLVYVESNMGNGTLVSKQGNSIKPVTSSPILPGLSVEFIRISARVIRVTLKASGNHVLVKDIFTQNANFDEVEADYDPVKYSFIRVKPID